MPKVTFVKAARKAIPEADIAKGESYYWWKFRHGGLHRSKTPPKPSQLTQSSFLSTVRDIQERAENIASSLRSGDITCSDAYSELQDLAQEVRDAGDEAQSSLDNMPESLQQGPTGEMLQTRIDHCEEVASEIEGIEEGDEDNLELDDDDLPADATEEQKAEREQKEDEERTRLREEIADEIEAVSWDLE